MTDLQAQLDRGAKSLRRMIAQSIAQAVSLCADGNAKGSADAWEITALVISAPGSPIDPDGTPYASPSEHAAAVTAGLA